MGAGNGSRRALLIHVLQLCHWAVSQNTLLRDSARDCWVHREPPCCAWGLDNCSLERLPLSTNAHPGVSRGPAGLCTQLRCLRCVKGPWPLCAPGSWPQEFSLEPPGPENSHHRAALGGLPVFLPHSQRYFCGGIFRPLGLLSSLLWPSAWLTKPAKKEPRTFPPLIKLFPGIQMQSRKEETVEERPLGVTEQALPRLPPAPCHPRDRADCARWRALHAR